MGAAAGSAQAAAAVAGGAQIAGNVAPGSIVAPYVQKRSPSGTLDNNLHDSEILKPKQVFAKQLDPFAATDAEPFLASPNAANRSLAPAPRVANPAPAMASASAPAAVIHSTPASANPFAEGDSALPLVVAKKANAPQAMTQPVSAPLLLRCRCLPPWPFRQPPGRSPCPMRTRLILLLRRRFRTRLRRPRCLGQQNRCRPRLSRRTSRLRLRLRPVGMAGFAWETRISMTISKPPHTRRQSQSSSLPAHK